MIDFVFYFFSFLAIGSAISLLLSRRVLYAAYSLLGCLLSISALFALLGADFLAVTQIMVYVGGILVLIVFGVMLTQKNQNQAIGQANLFWGGILSVILCGIFIKLIFASNFIIAQQAPQQGSQIQSVGIGLMTDYVFLFELMGILLLIGLIGALFLTKTEK